MGRLGRVREIKKDEEFQDMPMYRPAAGAFVP